MFDFEQPYFNLYRTKRFRSSGIPTVLHHRTCPVCESKLVNLYYSVQCERYLCKACLDKVMAERKEQT